MEPRYGATTNNNVSKGQNQDGNEESYGTKTGGPFSTYDNNGGPGLVANHGDIHLAMEHMGSDHKPKPKADRQASAASNLHTDHWLRMRNQNRLDTLCVVGFCLALTGFVSTFHLQVLPRIPYPLAGNLQDIDPSLVVLDLWREGVNLIPIVWGLKYIRKIGLVLMNFVCLMPYKKQETHPLPRVRASGRPLPSPTTWPFYILPVVIYHGGFGTWIGIATNYHLPYQTSDLEWVVVGLVVFLVGELTVITKSIMMCASQRQRDQVPMDPPVGILEVGEVVSCVGFACFTLTFPACVLAAVRTIIAVPSFMGFIHGKAF